MFTHGSASLQLFLVVWVSFVTTDEFSMRVTKITSRIGVSSTQSLPFYFFSKFKLSELWPYCQKHVSQIILRPSFEFCESFLESDSPEILALYETNLDDLIDCGNFFVRGYLPLMRKDSSTHTRGLAVYIKEVLPFPHNLSLENSADFYLCFRLALLYSASYFFFLCRSPSLSFFMVFYSISSSIDEVLTINPSANVFGFGDFNVHHKDWLTYSGGTD